MLGANDQSSVVTPGPWANRDGYVAETSIKLDRLQAKIDRLEYNCQAVKADVAGLLEKAEQSSRFQAFEESLRNSREYKIDELLRCVRDVKGRLDQIEGPRSTFVGLTYRSFDAVDKKLNELNGLQVKLAHLERLVTWGTIGFVGLFFAVVAATLSQLA